MLNFTSAQNKSKDITELQDKVDVIIFYIFYYNFISNFEVKTKF